MGKHNKKILIINILRIFFISMFIISTFFIIRWYIYNNQNKVLQDKLSEATTTIENSNTKYKVDFTKLKEINKETVAWIKVEGTKIEYPVVKSNDNSYYLNHNFEKKYNNAGWIFMDYRNKLDGTDKNIIIYGHNMKDLSMFGTLKDALSEEWYNNKENKFITFITETETFTYEVFSIYQIKNEEYYITTQFKEGEYEKFLQTLKERSAKDFNVELTKDDTILTLSTCANNNKYRVVLHAKKHY